MDEQDNAKGARKAPRRTISKSPSGRRPPAWVPYFLRALERAGAVREAAADAGIDFTSAYARRKAHADFAQAWDEALGRHRQARARAEAADADAAPTPSPYPSPAKGSGAKLVRAASERWSDKKERTFLEELTRTANVKRAAGAAGISTQALYRRRLKERRLAAAWDQAIEAGKARVQAYLVEAATRTFDPDALPFGDEGPTVSIGEAIHIAKLKAAGAGAAGWSGEGGFQEEQASEDHIAEVRSRLLERMARLSERTRREQVEKGWRIDAQQDAIVPPGWVRMEEIAIVDGGPRARAERHCPHCGGGLRFTGAGGAS